MLYSTSGTKQKRIQVQTVMVICIIFSVLLSSFAPLSVLAASPALTSSTEPARAIDRAVEKPVDAPVQAPAAAPSFAGQPSDFGDLPTAAQSGFSNSYPTTLANNGASHEITTTLRLGAQIDSEADGQPSANATGDDTAGTPDDEDGVQVKTPLRPGARGVIAIGLQQPLTSTVRVNGWIDFNQDGDFADSGEQIATDETSINGGVRTDTSTVVLDFPVPADAIPGTTYARFRLCSVAGSCNTPTGAATDGEVEDYQVTIPAVAQLGNYVWLDTSGDGVQQGGEPSVEGVFVKLYRASDNALFDVTTTDASGYYSFTSLLSDTYYLEFVAPSAYTFTTALQGGNPANDSNANQATGRTSNIVLAAGANDQSWDAGLTTIANQLAYCEALPWGVTEVMHTFSLPKFNPALGTLTGVNISSYIGLKHWFGAENRAINPQNARLTATSDASLTLPNNNSLDTSISLNTGTRSYAAYDGITDMSGTSSYSDSDWQYALSVTTTTYSTLANFAAASTGEKVDLPFETLSGMSYSGGGGNLAIQERTYALAGVCVNYSYTQVANPGGISINKAITTTDGSSPSVSGNFDVVVSCAGVSGYPTTFRLNADGTPFIVGNLVSGTVCSVNENLLTLPTAPSGYTWVSARTNPSSITIQSHVTPTVQVLNTLAPTSSASGVLTLTKTISGTGTGPFTVTVSGPSGYLTTTTINGGQSKVITGLLSGLYTVTETSPGAGWTTLYTATTGYSTGSSAIVSLTNSITATTFAATQITGTVFSDYNSDGRITANGTITDTGVQSVTVTIYDNLGNVTSTVSSASGRYTITPSFAGPYRVVFTNLPSGYEPSRVYTGTQNGTTVQFINTAGQASGVNLGINHPTDYCQNNPLLCTNLMINGGLNTTTPTYTLVSFANSYSNTTPAPALLEDKSTVGSTWGLAYGRSSGILYSAAFVKRHVAIGPSGLGAIYATDVKTGVTSLFADLTGLGVNVGTIASNATRGLGAPTVPQNDATVFDQVGKVGLGEIALSDDSATLYVTNLNDKHLYALSVPGGGLSGNFTIPDPGCVGGAWRPFATSFWHGNVYVGGVCDGQSSGQASNLRAYVYRFTPGANTFSQILNFPLTYAKGSAADSTCVNNKGWYAWISTMPTSCRNLGGANFYVWPQPLLSNIEFDTDGSMILGFMDRMGHQIGYDNYELTGTGLERGTSGGEILRAYNNNGTYVLESNGSAGSITTAGAGNGEGPGGGEFYYGDNFSPYHYETAFGGLATLPGSGRVVATAMDPYTWDQAGIYWFSNTTGNSVQKYLIYSSTPNDPSTFGKSSGLGDLELLCDAAPIEIGNRVWWDIDGDGVQDAGEPGLSNVQVTLTNPSGGTINTTTDINGNYVFTREATTGTYSTTLRANGNYTITINSTPSGYGLTTPNATALNGASVSSNHAISDVLDSDAALVSNTPTIYYTTGSAGQNNHGLDFGFTKPATGQVDILNTAPSNFDLGNYVWFDTNNNGITDTTEVGVAGVSVTLQTVTGTLTTVTNGSGYYSFTNLPAGTYTPTIAAANFQPGGVLYGYLSSGGSTSSYLAADNGHDHGIDPASLAAYQSNGVSGAPVTLGGGSLPTGEDSGAPATPNGDLANNLTADFGFYTQSVGNQVWEDLNNNGLLESGEPLLSNVAVALLDNNGNVISTTTTNGSGYYTFSSVLSGTYVISVTPPAGYVSSNGQDTGDVTDNNDNGAPSGNAVTSQAFSLTPGSEPSVNNATGSSANPTIDFGLWRPASLGDYVWEDINHDGQQNDGNTGVNGVAVALLDNSNNVVSTTTTFTGGPGNQPGYYTFTNLISGTYHVSFTVPTGYVATTADSGDDTSDSDGVANGNAAVTGNYTLNAGQSIPTVDQGLFAPAPAIDLIKYTNGDDADVATGPIVAVGSTVTWTYRIENTGNVTLTNVFLTDDKLSAQNPLTVGVTLSPGAIITVTQTGVATVGQYQNTGTVTGTNPYSQTGTITPTVSDSNPSHYFGGNPGLVLKKYTNGYDADASASSATPSGPYVAVGSTVTWTYVVSNTGNQTLSNVTLIDDQLSAQNPLTTGVSLLAGEVLTITKSGIAIAGQYTNTGTVTGTIPGGSVLTSTNPSHYFGVDPAIDLIKYTNGQDADTLPGPSLYVGDPVTWTYVLTNSGNVPLSAITLTDSIEGGVSCPQTTLDVGESIICSKNGIVTAGQYTNTGIVTGTPNLPINPTPELPNYPTLPTPNTPVTDSNPSHYYGVWRPASLGDYVWEDINHDGQQNDGNTGINGVAVALLDNSNNVVSTTTTFTGGPGNIPGYYTFTNLISATYHVSFTLPTGYQWTIANSGSDGSDSDGVASGNVAVTGNYVLNAGESIPTVDQGVWRPASLGDYVWEDINHDGQQNDGNTGVNGVSVALLDNSNHVVSTTTTFTGGPGNIPGYYTFTNLISGTYHVSFTVPAGYVATTSDSGNDTSDSDGVPNGNVAVTGNYTLNAGQSIPTVDQGLWQPLSLGNRVWYDTNNNGTQDGGEAGVAGVTLTLLDNSGNPVTSTVTGLVITATTNANGYYTFTNLISGTYKVQVNGSNFLVGAPLATYRNSDFTEANADSNVDLQDNGINPANLAAYLSNGVTSGAVVLSAGNEPTGEDHLGTADNSNNTNYTVDFGFYKLSVGDLVWNDINNNGQVDSGEPVLPNVPIALLDNSGNVISTTTTNSSGLYTFTGLISGTYVISITPPANYVSSTGQEPTDGNNNHDHGAPNGNAVTSQPFALTPGSESTLNNTTGATTNPNLDFGLWQPLELGNRVWYDADNGGDLDNGELGLAGVKLTLLDGSGNPVTSTVTGQPITTTTNANGYYTFTNLISGTYKVRVDAVNFQTGGVLQAYLSSTPTEADPNNDVDNNDNGIDPASNAAYLNNGVLSGLVTLSAGNEPINETNESSTGLADNNSNLSVDFGFLLWDRGDLPNAATATNSPAYSTTVADGGPSHIIIPGLRLGANEDGEMDGQPTATANGDDANGKTPDDEDGVTLPAFSAGQSAVVNVSVVNTTGTTAYVYGFIDFNGDGDFGDTGETVTTTVPGNGSVSSVPLTFTVPVNANANLLLGARFRISTDNNLTANGSASNGEVEDYLMSVKPYDMGDLPSLYPTALTDDGARHIISNGLYFGSSVDNEGDGQPSSTALGDDNNGTPDDEDGIVFVTPLMPGKSATISMTAYITPGLTAYYGAMIDFNGDGIFSASEIFTGTMVNGQKSLTFTVPGVVSDTVYSRFRLSSDPTVVSSPTGEAPDGEVEDYALLSVGNQLWFDSAPNTANDGEFDLFEQSVPAGVTVTLVVSGTTTPIAITTTHANGKYLFTGLPAGDYQVIVAAANFQPGGLLEGYVSSTGQESGDSTDDNDNGADLANPAATGIPSNGFSLTLGDEPSNDGNDTNSNLTIDFGLVAYDWGDLPDGNATNSPNYATLSNSNGPSHLIIDGLRIGSSEDGELNGQPTASANGDDSNGMANDDEDGVILPRFIPGQPATVIVNVTNDTGETVTVYGFIDFNGNGVLDDAGESVSASIDGNGVVLLPFNVPADADTKQPLGARFRLGLDGEPNLDSPTGAVASGEVEDYLIQMQPILGVIGNYVWLDEDADGEQDAGEPGLPNVIMTMIDDQGTLYTTTTDSQGGYLFPDLPKGIYTVTIALENFNPGGAIEGMEQTPLFGGDEDFGNKDQNGYIIDLSWGEENLTADFGYNPLPPTDVNNDDGLAALGDRVWIDSDGDGVQDPNEIPVEGVVLTLYTDPDGNGIFDTVVATDTTDANGFYLFDNLPAGAYVVKVTNSSAASHDVLSTSKYTQTGDPDHFATSGTNNDNMSTLPVVLAPGDLFLNVDFGYQPQPTAGLNSVGDTIWFDADADGNGMSQAPVDGGSTVTQGVGGTADTTDYGIAGVTVALVKDTNGNGAIDAGEPIIATDVTDSKGQYLFSGLADGKYIVKVSDTDNVLQGLKPTYDKDDGTSSPDEMSAVDLDSAHASAVGINDRLQDFGYTPESQQSGTGLIGDTIWFDNNRDGIQNSNESGIEGVLVVMTDGNGVTQTVITDENGHYTFANLPLNQIYTVTVAPENFAPGGVLEGMENTGDKEQDKNNTTTSELLTPNAPVDLTNDLGYAADDTNPIGRIGNLVWLDSNADGIWDGANGPDGIAGTDDDEPLIGGVTLDLYRDLNGNGKVDAGEPRIASTTTTTTSVTTSGDLGNYLFDNLPVVGNGDGDAAAEYVVDVTDVNGVLSGYWHSLGTANTTDNSQTDPDAVEISSAAPENLTADFGYYVEPAAVGNYVWVDDNGNGLQDDGETGINGVKVTLVIAYLNGTMVTVTTVTSDDASGNPGWYSFGNLLIDEDHNGSGTNPEPIHMISVSHNQPALAEYVETRVDANGNASDKLDSDLHSGVIAHPIQGLTDTAAKDPASNEGTIASYDFGYYIPASLGNYVWLDENADGAQDEGEPGLPNVVVVATNDQGNIYTTTTDSHGGYLFTDLVPGVYTVTVPASNFAPGGALEDMEQTLITGGNDSPDFGNKDDAGYTVELSSGEENLTADFGYNPLPPTDVNNNDGLAGLGDRVWIDSDGDGVQDPNETPVQGVVLTLYTDPDGNGIFDTPIATDTTDANGNYLFTDLPAGAYVVKVTDSTNASHNVLSTTEYTQTGDPDHFATSGTNNDNLSTSPVVLAPGDLFLNVDFGYQPLPAAGLNSVGDTIWFDADADGNGMSQAPVDGGSTITQGAGGSADAADYGIAGITVALVKDTNGNGVIDAGEPIIASDVTDSKGQYLFSGLADGKYIVKVTDTDNVLQGLKPTYDKDSGTSSPDEMSAVDLDSAHASAVGINDRLQDFGYTPESQQPGTGLIGDTIWFDSNRDGVQNPNEPGIEGVVVIMTDLAGNPLASTTTDENGHYYFGGLPLNEQYKVVVSPENFAPGGVLEGMENTGDKEQDKNNTTTSELLTSSAPIDLTNDLGYAANHNNPIGRVGNLVWLDSNADGVWDKDGADNLLGTDDDEPLIGGVTIDLYRDLNGNGKVDAGESRIASTTTTSTPVTTSGDVGNYLFDNLPVVGNGDGDAAAEYVVDVTDINGVLAGYWHSLGTVGSTNNSQADPYGVEISTTQPENLTADFGYYVEPAAVGNYVWVDSNGDGVQNDGETGLNGVEVTLKIVYPNGTTITVTAVTTDDASGNPGWYSFGNLLIDEDQNGDNVGNESVHTISVDLTQAALAGYKSTLIDVGGNDKLDADNPAGVVAKPIQGQTDTHAIDPASNEPSIASYDFGFYEPASLGDRVWFDSDRDGVQDAGEVGVSGVKVELLDKNGTVISDTLTDVSGIYTFAQLMPGVYSVRFTPPVGYVITTADQGDDTLDSDANPTTGQTVSTTLVSGENDPTWDAGLYAVVNLGNLVWHDANNDGLFNNGEQGIDGVMLQLFHAGDDPTTATPLLTTTTDVSGTYQFTNLLPGKYFVYIPTPPVAYPVSSTPTDSSDDGKDNDDNGTQNALGQPVISPVIDLSPNSEPSNDGDGKNGDLTIDFGFFAPASLGDLVWFDTDKDGVQDSIETGTPGSTNALGIANVLVTLFQADGTQVATTTTDIHGYYRFDNLLPGDYYVEFTPPAGYHVSPTDTITGTDVYDSDGLRTPVTNLTSGEHDPTLDLGLYLDTLPASIGDFVWLDSNNNGVQDSGESGIPGVKVLLFSADGTPVASTTTGLNGSYFFTALVPGDYYVQFVAPNGLTPSPKDVGSDDKLDSDADLATGKTIITTLDPGENDPNWDAGFFSSTPLASLGDKVWYDLDADGIQDVNETGVPGVVVKLYDGTGQLIATTTTDVQGVYGFNNLLPGDYYVEFTPIKKYIFSPQDKGQDDGKDSDADPYTHRTVTTTLAAGENDPTWDAGIYVPGAKGVVELPVSLGDRVWEDQIHDGIQDGNEPGIPGVTVKLYTDQGELITWMVTDADGFYHFGNLPAGAYYVEFVPPADYSISPTKVSTGTDVNDSDMDPGTGRSPIVDLPSGTDDPDLDAGLYKIPTDDEDVDEPELNRRIFLPVVSR